MILKLGKSSTECSGKSVCQGTLESLRDHLCVNKSLFCKSQFCVCGGVTDSSAVYPGRDCPSAELPRASLGGRHGEPAALGGLGQAAFERDGGTVGTALSRGHDKLSANIWLRFTFSSKVAKEVSG